VHILASGIIVQTFSQWNQFLFVPLDDGLEIVNDFEGTYFIKFKGSSGGVAEA
jgi:hypothetical protein